MKCLLHFLFVVAYNLPYDGSDAFLVLSIPFFCNGFGNSVSEEVVAKSTEEGSIVQFDSSSVGVKEVGTWDVEVKAVE